MPDWLGSATISTRSMPLTEAITGQPMPGEPSMMARSVSAGAFFSMVIFTSVTSLPELPRPIFRVAVEKIRPSASRYSSRRPAASCESVTAFWGQTWAQTPQPSQAYSLTRNTPSCAVRARRRSPRRRIR